MSPSPVLTRQEDLAKDLGKCVFKKSQGNSDRTANEQEEVVEAIGGSGRGVAKRPRTIEQCELGQRIGRKWESVVIERTAWDQEETSAVEGQDGMGLRCQRKRRDSWTCEVVTLDKDE